MVAARRQRRRAASRRGRTPAPRRRCRRSGRRPAGSRSRAMIASEATLSGATDARNRSTPCSRAPSRTAPGRPRSRRPGDGSRARPGSRPRPGRPAPAGAWNPTDPMTPRARPASVSTIARPSHGCAAGSVAQVGDPELEEVVEAGPGSRPGRSAPISASAAARSRATRCVHERQRHRDELEARASRIDGTVGGGHRHVSRGRRAGGRGTRAGRAWSRPRPGARRGSR